MVLHGPSLKRFAIQCEAAAASNSSSKSGVYLDALGNPWRDLLPSMNP